MATARAGNVIGGGDWANYRLIPDIINAFSNKQILSIRNPSAIRPWQHVLEPLTGYISLAEKLISKDTVRYDDAWNFGPDEVSHKNVEQVVKTISHFIGKVSIVRIYQSCVYVMYSEVCIVRNFLCFKIKKAFIRIVFS